MKGYFRICALLGISFPAAAAVAASMPAQVAPEQVDCAQPSSYADVLDASFLAGLSRLKSPGPARERAQDPWDNYFVKSSGEPFHKFDKGPD